MSMGSKGPTRWVGPLSGEQFRKSESFHCDEAALFIPSLGQCGLAVTPEHSHPGYLFLVVQDLYDGYPGLPDIEFTNSGDFIVAAFSPGMPHHEEESDDFIRYCALFVDPDFVAKTWNPYAPGGMPVFRGSAWKVGKEVFPLLRFFMAEYENDLPGCRDMMALWLRRLIHIFARAYHGIVVNTDRVTARTEVARAIEYIHRRFGEKISVADLASISGMSESHFARTFKSETGESPAAMLARIRLEKARKMLRVGMRTVSEVAYACGFSSPAHFSSAFAAAFGAPPSAYLRTGGR